MSGHVNAALDFQSANVPPSGLPQAEITPISAKHEKEMVFGATGGDAIQVTAAQELGDDIEEPTDEEYATLRKVPAPMKWAAIAMCVVELAERGSYYGCKDVFANFVRGKLPVGGNGAGAVAPGPAGSDQTAGALGMGSVVASATTSTFTFLAYLIPIFGGIIADAKWGRMKTIMVGIAVGAFAHALLVVPAIPAVIATGNAYIPFIISVIILAFAAGFIKPSLGPLLCDQSPVKRPQIAYTKSGERVILDPQATVQRYLLIFYWCINVGAFFSLATTYSERFVGFWLAFLEPGILYLICPFVLIVVYKKLYLAPPQGSVTLEAYRVVKTAISRGGITSMFKGGDAFWNAAKPSHMIEQDGTIDKTKVVWDDLFVDEIRQSIAACGVFLLIPIFNLADGGIGNMENDMSAAMILSNIPNDLLNFFNPVCIIVFTPIMTFLVYPFFAKMGRPIKPMTRMCIGFMLGSINMIIGAILQWKVYQTSPCGYHATDCELGVSDVPLLAQIPLYAIPALGEIFVNVTSYELAYTRAPARMKGLVYALCLFNQSISSAIALACSKAITDPNLIIPYIVLAVACAICAVLFPTYFRHLNDPMRSFADPVRQAGLQQPSYVDRTGEVENVDAKEKI